MRKACLMTVLLATTFILPFASVDPQGRRQTATMEVPQGLSFYPDVVCLIGAVSIARDQQGTVYVAVDQFIEGAVTGDGVTDQLFTFRPRTLDSSSTLPLRISAAELYYYPGHLVVSSAGEIVVDFYVRRIAQDEASHGVIGDRSQQVIASQHLISSDGMSLARIRSNFWADDLTLVQILANGGTLSEVILAPVPRQSSSQIHTLDDGDPTCMAGGPGSSQCSVTCTGDGGCGVTCDSGYYSCCNCQPSSCQCISKKEQQH